MMKNTNKMYIFNIYIKVVSALGYSLGAQNANPYQPNPKVQGER